MAALRERLKTLTKPFHDEVENDSLTGKIMDGTITKDEYIALLTFFYTTLEPLEVIIIANRHKFSIDVQKRLKSQLLKDALTILNAPIPNVAQTSDMEFERLVGMMYVFEGSTMGGMGLYKALGKIEFAQDARGYFLPYGDQTMAFWHEFIEFLNTVSLQEGFDDNKAILGACEMFLTLKQKININ